MQIGIIGSGHIGGSLGVRLGRAGHEVVFSYARTPDKLAHLASQAGSGSRVGSCHEAAACDVVVLAVRWTDLDDALEQAGDLTGAVVVDTINPFARDFSIALPETTTVGEQLARQLPTSRTVKAFNTLFAAALDPDARTDPPLVVFISGDDSAAKAMVLTLTRDAGFEPYDLGGMAGVWRQEWHGPLYTKEYTREQADAAVQALSQTQEKA